MAKTALITGIHGQDGHYLSEYLLRLGYQVYGLDQHLLTPPMHPLHPDVHVRTADLTDASSITRVIAESAPDEIYNLAAMSDVATSFNIPEYVANVDALGLIRILEVARSLSLWVPAPRIYQASTSEMFGNMPPPQSESTLFVPRSPYATAKVFAHHTALNYREAYGMFVACGILFNHESPIRGENFVTRKITRGLSRIKVGLQDRLYLGNLDSKRDWGHARDYVRAQHLILQQDEPDDFVIATGIQHSVREFVDIAAQCLGMDITWNSEYETAIDWNTGEIVVEVRPEFYRPLDVEDLCGDPTKAREVLGWEPEITFEQLVEEMVRADYDLAKQEAK